MTTATVRDSRGNTSQTLRLNLLGAFELEVRGEPVTALSRASRSVVALLALRSGQLVERDYLSTTLWPDSDDAAARYNLRRTLTELRAALGAEAVRLESPTKQTLTLDLSGNGVFCDVAEFDAALKVNSQDRLEEALRLYAARGALFPGERGEWIVPEREARRQAYLAAREKLAVWHAERSEIGEAIRQLREVLSVDPLRETALRDLMRRLSESGQAAAALSAYRSLAVRLRADADASPDAGTTALYERLFAELRERPEDSPLPKPVGDPSTIQAPRALPRPLATLIGRERDRIEVASYLHGDKDQSSSRLVTLTGAGGVGKTQLAIAAAESVLPDYADGVRFVDLASIRDPKQILSLIARALRMRDAVPRTNEALLDQIVDTLRPLHLLLILDNCEHLVADAASLALNFLRQCPHLTILATSREPLRVPGEVAWRVPGLERDAAVRLFAERAMQVNPAIRSITGNDPAVRNIAARLDGIPLAIEMAAARVRVMSVEQISARLESVFRLLTVPGGDLLPRHRTLRATLDWSYDLLGDEERTLLARLSVFAGGWTLDAAEAVGAGDGGIERDNVLDLLASLVEKSLVQYLPAQEGETDRYALLETIRQYGAEKLTGSGEAGDTRNRHRDWCLALAQEANPHLFRATAQPWNARLEAEHDNFRAARAWCAANVPESEAGSRASAAFQAGLTLSSALTQFWLVRGYISEGRESLDRALTGWRTRLTQQATDAESALSGRDSIESGDWPEELQIAVVRALTSAGSLANAQGDSAAALSLAGESLRLSRKIDYKNGIAASLANRGTAAHNQSDFAGARKLHEESLELYRELEQEWSVASALNNLGTAAQGQGDYAAARAFHEESLAIRRALGDQGVIADSLNSLGVVTYKQGDYAAAKVQYTESMSIHRGLGNRRGVANALNNLGLIAADQGDYAEARLLLEESLTLKRETGDRKGIASGLDNLAGVLFNQGDLAMAQSLFEEGLQLRRELVDRSGMAISLSNLGVVAAQQGDLASARSRYTESLAVARETGDKSSAAMALMNLGSSALDHHELRVARAYFVESLCVYHDMAQKRGIADCLGRIATVTSKEGDKSTAVRLWAAEAAWRTQSGLSQPPTRQAEDAAHLAEARAALGGAGFARAWDEGGTMGLEQAVAETLASSRT